MVGNITVSSHEVDLRKKPATVFPIPEDATSITIGDLHGNAMKLINFLLAYGLISLDEEQYQTLFKIYNKPTKDLASSDIISFDNIIQRHLTVNRSTLVVRLIGDELADRGANDYFTLSVLHRLQADGKVKIETIASNHGMEFMKAYFHGQLAKEAYFATETILGEAEQGSEKGKKVLAQRQSAFNLRHCLNEKMIDFSRLSELVEEHVETLCLLSYDFSESHGLTLYSHAPIDTRNIANLCQVFNLTEHYEKKRGLVHDYLDLNDEVKRNPQKIIALINAINSAFSESLKGKDRLELFDTNTHKGWEIFQTVWQRASDVQLPRPSKLDQSGYAIHWVHGHDSAAPENYHIFNLDSSRLGKDVSQMPPRSKSQAKALKSYLTYSRTLYSEGNQFYSRHDFLSVSSMLKDIKDIEDIEQIQARYNALKADFATKSDYYEYINDDPLTYNKNEGGELKVLIATSSKRPEAQLRSSPNTGNWRKFDAQLRVAFDKIGELRAKKEKSEKYRSAYDCAIKMHFHLYLLRDLCQKELLTTEQFGTTALKQILEAEQILVKCRTNWKPVLQTLAVSATIVGLGYRLWKACSGGSFWVEPDSDSKHKLIDPAREAVRAVNGCTGRVH